MKLLPSLGPLRTHMKLVLIFILLMLLVYALGFYVSLDLQNQVRAELTNSVNMRMGYLAKEIDKDVTHLKTQQHQLKLDVNMQKLLLVPNRNDMGMVTDLVNYVYRRIFAMQNSSIYANEAVVCLPQLDRTVSSASFYVSQSQDDLMILQSEPENGVLALESDGIYLVERLTQRFMNQSPAGSVCYIRLSMAALSQSLAQAASSRNVSVYLLSGSRVLLQNGGVIEGFAGEYAAAGGPEAPSQITINRGRYHLIRKKIESLGLDLVACIPEKSFEQILLKNQLWMILLTAAAIVSFITFALFANRMIYRPINRFVQAFHEVEHDNLDVKIDHHATDEFAYMYNTFNNMISRLKTSIQQVYQKEIATKQAELKQLQSQINPHFLYNSFFHIYRMCKMEDSDGVADFSLKLSKFYQYITRSGQEHVPLEMEYRHAQDYSDIQSVRYGSRIQVRFEPLPEEFRSLPVPKLILQPVLENAYQHGSEEREESTVIHVHCASEEGILRIIVEDNGSGMDRQSMERLARQMMGLQPPEETTGLINVSSRLRYKYGGSSGVHLASSRYGGLRVELWIELGQD